MNQTYLIDGHFTREKIDDDHVSLPRVASRDELQFFSPSLRKKRHEFFIGKLMIDHHHFGWGEGEVLITINYNLYLPYIALIMVD